MPVSYIPTLQSPLQGNNLPNVVNALKGNATIPMNNMLSSSPSNPLSSSMSSLGQAFNSDGGPSSTYGGFNYNQFVPGSGVSGANLAQAAQAGVQSGLTFNPSTGTVS